MLLLSEGEEDNYAKVLAIQTDPAMGRGNQLDSSAAKACTRESVNLRGLLWSTIYGRNGMLESLKASLLQFLISLRKLNMKSKLEAPKFQSLRIPK